MEDLEINDKIAKIKRERKWVSVCVCVFVCVRERERIWEKSMGMEDQFGRWNIKIVMNHRERNKGTIQVKVKNRLLDKKHKLVVTSGEWEGNGQDKERRLIDINY